MSLHIVVWGLLLANALTLLFLLYVTARMFDLSNTINTVERTVVDSEGRH